jgi:uncharacterized protein
VAVSALAAEPFVETSAEPAVRGYLQRASGSRDVLVLTHGAGGNCQAPLLVALSEAFAAKGISVLRCDLPFRQKRPRGAPSPANAKEDQAGLRRAVVLMREQFGGRAFLGGQSYGGRQASMLVAAEPELVDGLLLLSYPLHRPGKPSQLRTAHLPELRVPTLFIHGTKDPFGTIAELEDALKLIPVKTKLIPIEKAGHSLAAKGGTEAVVTMVVADFWRVFSR